MTETATKPAEKKAKVEKVEEPYALVSKFDSHGVMYTSLRISRPTADKLKKGSVYDLNLAADGTITLKPNAAKSKAKARRK